VEEVETFKSTAFAAYITFADVLAVTHMLVVLGQQDYWSAGVGVGVGVCTPPLKLSYGGICWGKLLTSLLTLLSIQVPVATNITFCYSLSFLRTKMNNRLAIEKEQTMTACHGLHATQTSSLYCITTCVTLSVHSSVAWQEQSKQ